MLALLSIAYCAITLPAFGNPFFGNTQTQNTPPSPMASGSGPLWELQIQFREKLASIFTNRNEQAALLTYLLAIGIAFVYGLAHASGPGHRKTIVFSLFLAEKTSWWEPLFAGFFSALIHTVSGALIIALISIIRGALANLASSDVVLAWTDGITLLVLIAIAVFMITIKIVSMIRKKGADKGAPLATKQSKYLVIFVASIVPCTGTIMVLLFSLYLEALPLGIAALIGIALGQGVIVSIAAYLAWFGRESIFFRLKKNEKTLAVITTVLELGSWLFLGLVSFVLAQPFLGWLFSI